MERIHEGILSQNQHKRYCLYEPGVPEHKMLTCTSGCRLEVWLNRAWIAGQVEGDGEDYWFFADGGEKFLLAERMKARYTEHHWRRGMRDISGICSSPSIRITWQDPSNAAWYLSPPQAARRQFNEKLWEGKDAPNFDKQHKCPSLNW